MRRTLISLILFSLVCSYAHADTDVTGITIHDESGFIEDKLKNLRISPDSAIDENDP